MLTKVSLKQQFAKDWQKYYQVELFREKGFQRRTCSCGNNFWTLDAQRKKCGNPPCEEYGFIGKPVAKVCWDYVETWKQFERFFKKEGHASVPRYPVVDRWRPDLYFTIASIQDFQRIDSGKMVFEYPANPLVVPQVCLRFPDIPNVGVTGRHSTCFVMSGQHAFGFPNEGYFKDRCMELNFKFLNTVMKIPEKELTYIEDVWAMPDFSAFGPSIECLSRGLELVNHVFMEFTKSGSSFKELDIKVNDTGWGHERLVWFSNGTKTSYDSIFEPVVSWLKKQTGVRETELFGRYATLAAGLDVEDRDMKKAKAQIAKTLAVPLEEIEREVAPLQAMYAIADHTRALLFAAADGGIPSNVGGGYNLRVILRRMLAFMQEFGFSFDLVDVAELHAKQLKRMFPELKEGIDLFSRIIAVESERYKKTLEKALSIVQKEVSGQVNEEKLISLYTSHGIAPETVERVASEQGRRVEVPEDFYARVTAHHLTGAKEKEVREGINVDLSSLPPTRLLYYEDPYQKEMSAVVLKVFASGKEKWVALDQTVFYPEGGGQPADRGVFIVGGEDVPVTDVQKIGGIVLHRIEGNISAGTKIKGKIDWERRNILIKMHDATHILAGACRKILGKHAWQSGAQKGVDSSRLDITHFQSFSQEELEKIESVANDVVKKDIPIHASFMKRGEAEQKYGFEIYQGGASPGKEVRIVGMGDHDVEACSGTHGRSTGGVGIIKIVRSERIQDGVNRIEFTAGEKAHAFIQEMEQLYASVLSVFKKNGAPLAFEEKNKIRALHDAAGVFSVDVRSLPKTVERFFQESGRRKVHGSSLGEVSSALFSAWKEERKKAEKDHMADARKKAENLLKKMKNNQIAEIVSGERKELIQIAGEVLVQNPEVTVILANHAGEIVGMSRSKDMASIVKSICQKASGSGGGRKDFAQGKAELSKLMKVFEEITLLNK